MSLSTLYGINGVGKDTIAAEVKRAYADDITITSMSRLCMFLLGITESLDSQEPVDTTAYRKLESVPQSEMRQLEDGPCKEYIQTISENSQRVLMLSHLVFALHIDLCNVTYLTDRRIPDWYIQANNAVVQLKAPAETILARRFKDAFLDNARERPTALDQILDHQALCDEEWQRLSAKHADLPRGMHIVQNQDIDQATKHVYEVLYA